MNIEKMLEELRAEREAIDEAIVTLERLGQGHRKRRGRPPAWLAEIRHREAVPAPAKHEKKGKSEVG